MTHSNVGAPSGAGPGEGMRRDDIGGNLANEYQGPVTLEAAEVTCMGRAGWLDYEWQVTNDQGCGAITED